MNTPAPSQPVSPLTRRDFIARSMLVGAAVQVGTSGLLAATAPKTSTEKATRTKPQGPFEIAAFEKHFFEKYSPEETAQTCDEMGLHLELTLRPEGHVKPERAPDELPVIAAALAKRQRRILMLASSFRTADEPHLEAALRTAKKLGITQYRHRGFRYEAAQPLKAQLADFRSQMRDLAALNKSIGIQGLYQNHAGSDYVGAAIWDLDQLLDDVDPRYFGVALDTRHLLVESGRAWPTALRLIGPRIASLYVKSFRWDRERTIETPLRDGIVNQAVIDQILAQRTPPTACIHVEYPKLQPTPFAQRATTVDLFRDDARVLRGWLG